MLVNDKGNLHDVSILEVTAENYICPKGEEHLYHCRIEQKFFNQQTGERVSVPRIQKFDKKQFEGSLLHNLRRIGYSVDILYNPNKWLEENEAKQAEAKAKAIEAQKAAQEAAIQARIDAAVKEAVAQALAAQPKAGAPSAPKATAKKGGKR